jgi:hypothetical protein
MGTGSEEVIQAFKNFPQTGFVQKESKLKKRIFA